MLTEKNSDIFLSRIQEIKKCLELDCYYAALSLSLTLPDICGRAEYPEESVTKRYTQWYNQYIGKFERPQSPYSEDMPYLSGEVLYNLRNSFLHTGNPNIEKEKVKEELCRIDEFNLVLGRTAYGDTSCVSYGQNMVIKCRAYSVDVRELCIKLYKVAESFYKANIEKFDFFHYNIEYLDEE